MFEISAFHYNPNFISTDQDIFSTMFGNFFSNIPQRLPDELFETILKQGGIEIERIISRGHATPEGKWYDQDWDEWILLLQGRAALTYQDADKPVHLKPGDYLLIPAHRRHRVDWTDPALETIWLAIHWHQARSC